MEIDYNLTDLADLKDKSKILSLAHRIFSLNYEDIEFENIVKSYNIVIDIFEGRFPGYKACNTVYHDLIHTLDALLATIRLIDGYNIDNKKIPVDISLALLKAALFHDIGYIQEENDKEGTGAKYTNSHVSRSIKFVSDNYKNLDIKQNEIELIGKFINCTELTIDLNTIQFESETEKIAGRILGAADILGQMSDREYLERLLFLYYDFKEAGIPGYDTEYDIIKNTLIFYEEIRNRMILSYKSIHEYALIHFDKRYGVKENLYLTAIQKNIDYIKKIVSDNSSNFRAKLKRGGWREKAKVSLPN